MYRIITSIITMLISVCLYAQYIPGVKQIEIVSEIQDSMVLLNKPDVDKINKTYFEKNKLDSLNFYNESLIYLLENKVSLLDSINLEKDKIIRNHLSIQNKLNEELEWTNEYYEKQLRKENNKKIWWQTATAAGVVGIILALIFK